MEWEQIDDYLWRAMVPGGWIVKHEAGVIHDTESHGMVDGWDWRTSICFVPDEEHYWVIPKK